MTWKTHVVQKAESLFGTHEQPRARVLNSSKTVMGRRVTPTALKAPFSPNNKGMHVFFSHVMSCSTTTTVTSVSCSRDLSPSENTWHIMKQKVKTAEQLKSNIKQE